MKRTYIDANILIAAFRGDDSASRRAMAILDDPDRKLIVSDYLRLEVMPKPYFQKRQEEVEFMETMFVSAAENVPTSPKLTNQAIDLAMRYDLTPIDALHVSAALMAEADELVTMEKANKPMCQVREVAVISLHSAEN